MPWYPPGDVEPERDPRLDPYRYRAARMTASDGSEGYLYVDVDVWFNVVKGFLWWKKFSEPFEVYQVFYESPDGDTMDYLLPPDDPEDLNEWAAGRCESGNDDEPYYPIEWLSLEESRDVRRLLIGDE